MSQLKKAGGILSCPAFSFIQVFNRLGEVYPH